MIRNKITETILDMEKFFFLIFFAEFPLVFACIEDMSW